MCDGFSRCCAVSWSMTSNERSGAGARSTSDVNITPSLLLLRFTLQLSYAFAPTLEWKKHMWVFSRAKSRATHAARRLRPAGAQPGLRDGLAVTHIFLLFSFTTHTCREIRAARGLSWPNRLCGFPFDLCRACGEADLDHNMQQKAISRLQEAGRWVCNMALCVSLTVSSIRVISGARQRPPTGFLTIFASLGTNFPTAD